MVQLNFPDHDIHFGNVETPNVSKALVCHAHQHGVRVQSFTYWNWNTPGTWSQLANVTKRNLWVDWQVATVQRLGLDGISVDIEAQSNVSLRASLTALICELRAALKAAVPSATVSFCLDIWPLYGTKEPRYCELQYICRISRILPLKMQKEWRITPEER